MSPQSATWDTGPLIHMYAPWLPQCWSWSSLPSPSWSQGTCPLTFRSSLRLLSYCALGSSPQSQEMYQQQQGYTDATWTVWTRWSIYWCTFYTVPEVNSAIANCWSPVRSCLWSMPQLTSPITFGTILCFWRWWSPWWLFNTFVPRTFLLDTTLWSLWWVGDAHLPPCR